jgi:hypothetical protein
MRDDPSGYGSLDDSAGRWMTDDGGTNQRRGKRGVRREARREREEGQKEGRGRGGGREVEAGGAWDGTDGGGGDVFCVGAIPEMQGRDIHALVRVWYFLMTLRL